MLLESVWVDSELAVAGWPIRLQVNLLVFAQATRDKLVLLHVDPVLRSLHPESLLLVIDAPKWRQKLGHYIFQKNVLSSKLPAEKGLHSTKTSFSIKNSPTKILVFLHTFDDVIIHSLHFVLGYVCLALARPVRPPRGPHSLPLPALLKNKSFSN